MAGFTGMDVAEVRKVAAQLGAVGQNLRAISAAVEHLVSVCGTAGWEGQDAIDFLGWWQHQHRPALIATADAIEGLGRSANNNAAEQDRKSGGHVGAAVGAVGGIAATAGATFAGGAGQVASATPSGSVARNDALEAKTGAFVEQWNGKYLDYDKKYGNQCYDVFSQYNHDVVGGPDIYAGTTGGAKDIYNDYTSNGASADYDRIAVGTGQPHVGDVVVWGNGEYGHVGIVTTVTDSGFTSLEQNTNGLASSTITGALTHEVSHTFSATQPLGYLRPKG